MTTTRDTRHRDDVLYSIGIFFLMFCFQKTYQAGIFFIDYRYTYFNMVMVPLLAIVFTAVHYIRNGDMIFIGRVAHRMSVAVVLVYAVYRLLLRDWVLRHFEYITDDYHLMFCVLCLAGVGITMAAAAVGRGRCGDDFAAFYGQYVRGVAWLFVLCFIFVYFLNRDRSVDYAYMQPNLTPLHGELAKVFSRNATSYDIVHFLGNVGFYTVFTVLVMSGRRHSVAAGIIVPIAVSALLEVYQYLTVIGDSDIDDVITNAVGVIIGVVIYRIIIARLLTPQDMK